MSDFDPGPGWREVSSGTYAAARGSRLREDPFPDDNGLSRYWVREVPVPALPTAPYTVIRVTWREDEGPRNLVRTQAPQESMWQTLTTGPVKYWGSKTLAELITSFEVLSEPRAATAKAILKALAATANEIRECDAVEVTGERWRAIALNFGVES